MAHLVLWQILARLCRWLQLPVLDMARLRMLVVVRVLPILLSPRGRTTVATSPTLSYSSEDGVGSISKTASMPVSAGKADVVDPSGSGDVLINGSS